MQFTLPTVIRPRAKDNLGVEHYLSLRDQLQRLEDKGASIQELASVVDERVENLETRLRTPLDQPGWGPSSWLTAARPKSAPGQRVGRGSQAGQMALAEGASPANSNYEIIARNLDQSERYHGFRWLYMLSSVFGIAVFLLAMTVDYQIMTEFWTRALANEFLEVPPSLANSILFKSAQVIIATVAFHYFISMTGWFGHTIGKYALVVIAFLLSLAMVFGFGLINTNQSVPAEKTAMFQSSPELGAQNDPFAQFGIGAASLQPAAPAPLTPQVTIANDTAESVQLMSALSWIIAPAIVFFVVTAVGALSLHVAESNIKNWVKVRDFQRRKAHEQEWRALRILQNNLRAGTAVPRQD